MSRWRTDQTSPPGLSWRSTTRSQTVGCSAVGPRTNRGAAVLRRCAMSSHSHADVLVASIATCLPASGEPKAIIATARQLALLVYRVLAGDLFDQNSGANVYYRRHLPREHKSVCRRTTQFGYDLIDSRTQPGATQSCSLEQETRQILSRNFWRFTFELVFRVHLEKLSNLRAHLPSKPRNSYLGGPFTDG
jgi:hypothetical protein